MPVTFKVSNHPSNAWKGSAVTSRELLFQQSCRNDFLESTRIIQSSVSPTAFKNSRISASSNGFVYAAWEAYSRHHHLTIRPDDIWFAILSQLNFYISVHAEHLRSYFVEHQDKIVLVIRDTGTINTYDFSVFARRMILLIQDNVKDPDLRNWIMPAFSTTTVDDRTTAAVLMMGSLQEYFVYTAYLLCGIPSVTLLGTSADYEEILHRLDKLEELGPETTDWARLLRPIVGQFIASFDDTRSAETRDFWSKIAHSRGGSGPCYISGWLTAFCFWRNDGVSLYYRHSPDFNAKYIPNPVHNIRNPEFELDHVMYHTIKLSDVPSGFASVPVDVNDGVVHRTKMVAGSIGIDVTKSGERSNDGQEKWDSVRSLSGWFMYERRSEK